MPPKQYSSPLSPDKHRPGSKTYTATIDTSAGAMTAGAVRLRGTAHGEQLCSTWRNDGFYEDGQFHRVISGLHDPGRLSPRRPEPAAQATGSKTSR